MKIIKNKTDLPTPCKTCRKLRQTVRIPVYHCALKLHFPTVKNTCKREDMKTVPLFKKFLRENGVYGMYCRNFDTKYNHGTIIKRPHLFIRNAFDFVGADGGYFFWRWIDKKWVKLLEERK